jgi:hypothetical protein
VVPSWFKVSSEISGKVEHQEVQKYRGVTWFKWFIRSKWIKRCRYIRKFRKYRS